MLRIIWVANQNFYFNVLMFQLKRHFELCFCFWLYKVTKIHSVNCPKIAFRFDFHLFFWFRLIFQGHREWNFELIEKSCKTLFVCLGRFKESTCFKNSKTLYQIILSLEWFEKFKFHSWFKLEVRILPLRNRWWDEYKQEISELLELI